jgi:hypothetical protein
VIGAVTPVFDGFSVAVGSLESRAEGFGMEVEVAPGVEVHEPFNSSVLPRQLAWWALDDRGNHYLGQIGGWSSSDEHSSGELEFWPALHPRATRLQIMPTDETMRAVISLPLPWANESPARRETPK